MENLKKLSKAEFVEMLQLIKRHAVKDMDQWAIWKLDSTRGNIYISISNTPLVSEEEYIELNHLIL